MEHNDLLTAGKINQVKFPRQFQLCLHVFLLDVDQKNTVTTRAVLVHVCRSNQKKLRYTFI